jgi:NADH-quinone oxidoreductase subunit E
LSVRRLAEKQPKSFEFSKDSLAKAKWWLAKYPDDRKQSAIIPILWLVQKQEGWVCEPALRKAAEMCDLAFVRAYEVATFYTMFQLEPVGKVLVQVCGTTPCMLRGANDLMKLCREKIGPRDQMSADGWFTWQEVECLGACCNAPMAQINDYYYEDLTPETLGQILDDFKAGKKPWPGSYEGRKSSEPAGGPLTLTDPALYDGSLAKPIPKLPNAQEPQKA